MTTPSLPADRPAGARALSVAVAVACVVPISAGLSGVLSGTGFILPTASVDLDSHTKYLSGLLLGIGIAFATTLPRVEEHGSRFRLLTLIVFLGGLARLGSLLTVGVPSAPMLFGLVMELAVTPGLALWQARVAARVP